MFFKMKLLFILSLALLLSGCGDLLGKKVKKKELGTSFAEVSCDLNVDEFTEIMNRNISSQINCLHENLRLFTRIVKSGKPGYLSRIQLERYLAEFRPDVKPEIVKALKSIFELGHVITGEEVDYISKETIDKVMNFLLKFNEEAALHFGPIFQSESQVSYELHKNHQDRVRRATQAIVGELRIIYNPNRNGQIHKINLNDLLDSFVTEETRESIEKAKKLLFAKKVLLGGDSVTLTHTELEKVILNFEQFILIALDAVRYKYIELEQDSILQLLKRDVDDLYAIITRGELNNRDDEVLFTMDEAIKAVKLFVSEDDLDIDAYKNLINEVKTIAMGGNTTDVKGREVKKLFDHAKSLLNTGNIFYRIWDKFQVQLMSPNPITINFDEYRHTYPTHQVELDQFERIVKKYRFFKGKFIAPYYTRAYKRNAPAIFEISLFEYGLKLVFQKYGRPSTSSPIGGYAMDRMDMQKLIKKFERELIDLDLLLPRKAEGLADNISLLGTLFQYQSDTNNVLDINEMTEFVVTLFTGLEMDDDVFNYIKGQNCPVDEFDRIEANCFRENFWQAVCKDYKGNFPLMFESFGAACENLGSNKPAQDLINNSMKAGRSCSYFDEATTKKEEIPYSKGDVMTAMIVLMHVETTMSRWDKNNNNILDSNELNDAYTIYGPALDGFLEDKSPIIKKLKKQIYLYLLKYEQVPNEKEFKSIWKFVKFILNFNKNVTATRKTMASVLVAIGAENAKGRTGPQFDCEWMRNPETIPEDDTVSTSGTVSRSTTAELLVKTSALINSYSASNKAKLIEQLADFTEDMLAGTVGSVKDVRQKDLKKLFQTIAADASQMNEIRSVIREGSDLDKIGFAVSSILLAE